MNSCDERFIHCDFLLVLSELSKQITKETTKFRNASAAGEMVDGR